MLSNLTQRISQITKTLKGEARISESNITQAIRDLRLALLEADVALPVVKALIESIRNRAIGEEVLASLTPSQAFIGIVHDELCRILSHENSEIQTHKQTPAIILLVGLQGAGKTSTLSKLAFYLTQLKHKKVFAVSCDVYRPAAIEQMHISASAAGAQILPTIDDNALKTAKNALEFARKQHAEVLLVDSAGRLAVDDNMMQELTALHQILQPIETLFVLDTMTGQDAAKSARIFHERIALTGVILSKVDGDARGGAALSVKHITGIPIKFVGVSEKHDGLQAFDAKRMVDRILGMGDIVALVEQVRNSTDLQAAKALSEKVKQGKRFDLNDFLGQIQHMDSVGGMQGLINHLPSQIQHKAEQVNMLQTERQMLRMRAMIQSMTSYERTNPDVIKASRKKRIALGAGVAVQDLNRMLKQFEQIREMMKHLRGGKMFQSMARLKQFLR